MSAGTVVVVSDPLESLLPGHDTTVALMEAAQDYGFNLMVTTPQQLAVRGSEAVAHCRSVRLAPCRLVDGHWQAPTTWWRTVAPETEFRLASADMVWMRKDPPVDADFLRATYLLDAVDPAFTLMVNTPSSLREANEKLFALRYPHLIPETLVSADHETLVGAVKHWEKAVLKPTDAMAGRGVLLLSPADPNLHSLVELSTRRGRRHVVLQRFLPESVEGDRRVIVVDGEPVGAVRRVAAEHEFRCNMAAGASVWADTVTTRDKEICEVIGPDLRRLGILLAGIDIIGDRLIEVNVTSPTGVREIDALCSSRVAHTVVQRLTELIPVQDQR